MIYWPWACSIRSASTSAPRSTIRAACRSPKMRERLRHGVSLSAAYSSDLGGSGGVTWTDRNVFGNAEQLTLKASVINFGGSDTKGVGYDTSAAYLIPDFGRRDQQLQFTVGAIKQSLQAYD